MVVVLAACSIWLALAAQLLRSVKVAALAGAETEKSLSQTMFHTTSCITVDSAALSTRVASLAAQLMSWPRRSAVLAPLGRKLLPARRLSK